MKVSTKYKKRCGIYAIKNLVNGKVYVGKAIDIYRRLLAHINGLNRNSFKHDNSHLISAWNKYGRISFECVVLEECALELLKERELFWMQKLESLDPKRGYNKRLDSSGGMIPHEETRKKLSAISKKRLNTPEEKAKRSKFSKKFWRENPEIKERMRANVKRAKQKKWRYIKMDEDGNTLKVYDTVEEIIAENPEYKWQNIYSVCNGYKKRIYGFKWRRERKDL